MCWEFSLVSCAHHGLVDEALGFGASFAFQNVQKHRGMYTAGVCKHWLYVALP